MKAELSGVAATREWSCLQKFGAQGVGQPLPGRQVAAWWQLHSWAVLEKKARRPSNSSTVSAVKYRHMASFAEEEAHRE